MNNMYKVTVMLVLFLSVACKVSAQKFTTHAVKKGETLTAIAKQYNVSVATILTYNKEISKDQSLQANTILVIPASTIKKTVATPDDATSTVNTGSDPREPIGYTSHKVSKKETLYGITKRYHITEDELKKYNPELYSTQLKKKMILRIPKYKRVQPTEESVVTDDDFDMYTVAPQETRWSISNKYGITVDELIALNPSLSKNNDYLSTGQTLKLPKLAGSSVENQTTQLFVSYTVPPKMNFYQLNKQFGVDADEIIRLNPEITEKGGLKEGMVIRIPQTKADPNAVNTENYIFYEVKPKENEFRLTRKLGISYKDLLALNPELSEGLKAGMVLKLPKDQTGNFEVRNALVLDKIDLRDSVNVTNVPKIMFMLPFRANDVDINDEDDVTKKLSKSGYELSLGFYSGALIALDSIANLGVSVQVKTYDSEYSLAKVKSILATDNLSNYDAIVGPLALDSFREVAKIAEKYNVPVIAPINTRDLGLKNVFYFNTSEALLRNKLLNHLEKQFKEQNVIIIADTANSKVRDTLLKRFPKAKVAKVKEEKKNIGVNLDELRRFLSKEQENWVFLETNHKSLIPSVTSILNSLNNSTLEDPNSDKTTIVNEKVKIKLFTTDKGRAFEEDAISSTHLSNLKFTYPSIYKEGDYDMFAKRYLKKFGDKPDFYAERGFDITMDLLLKLAYKTDLFEVSKIIGETEYSANKFSYEKDFSSGYFNQSSYIMMYDDLRLKEVKTE